MSTTIEDRQIRRRLAILRHAEEVTGNVAMTCRYYGISRQTFQGGAATTSWDRRTQGPLPPAQDQPEGHPHRRPQQDPLRAPELPLRAGQIAMYLARYHDMNISNSGVWRILKRLDLNRRPASQRYKRLDRRWRRDEKQLPGHQVQIDVKFIAPLAGAPRRKWPDPLRSVHPL